MQAQIYRPEGALAKVVDFMWLDDGYAPPWKRERLLPSRVFALILNLRGEPFRMYDGPASASCQEVSDFVISGMQSRSLVLDSASRASTVGVVIKPGWAASLLERPVDEFTDRTVALQDLWTRDASKLGDRIRAATTPASKFRVLQRFLEDHLDSTAAGPHPAVRMGTRLLDASGQVPTVRDVAERTGLSQRRFSQLFREQLGLSPKQYARVCRFQEVLNSITRRGDIDWLDITFSACYYDQSHFIHDFRKLAGCTPTDYLRSETENMNHVAIPQRDSV